MRNEYALYSVEPVSAKRQLTDDTIAGIDDVDVIVDDDCVRRLRARGFGRRAAGSSQQHQPSPRFRKGRSRLRM